MNRMRESEKERCRSREREREKERKGRSWGHKGRYINLPQNIAISLSLKSITL